MLQKLTFFASNRASNVILLKAKLLPQNSGYKHVAYVLENYSQVGSKFYLCSYQKKSYPESIGRSFHTQYFCPKFFIVRDYSGRFQDCKEKQNKVRSLAISL